jgi:hypothetical protein
MTTPRIMWLCEYRDIPSQIFETPEQAERIGATQGDVVSIAKVEIRKVKS